MTTGALHNLALPPAVLMLEDGTMFLGASTGAAGEACGEISFNTVMIGYPEVISDPANAGQIVTMTYPQIGNYGIATVDLESSRPTVRALVVRDICPTPSNYRSDSSLPDFLAAAGIVAITEVDTRSLIRHLRTRGTMKAIVSTLESDPQALLARLNAAPRISEENLVATVSTEAAYLYKMSDEHVKWHGPAPLPRFKVVAVDLGVTRSTLDLLCRLGCAVIVVPWNTPAQEILSYAPDGVLLSSGPGDPRVLNAAIKTAGDLMGKVPLMAVGLGHLVLAIAAGATVGRLRTGHHGGNYPVINLVDESVSITSQSHGFALRFESLGQAQAAAGRSLIAANDTCGRIQLTEINLNDNTVEALRYLDIEAFSVQYHPEVAPGPISAATAYDGFLAAMQAAGERVRATGQTSSQESEADNA